MDALLDTLTGRLLTSAQLSVIIERLPGGSIPKSIYSTVRLELIVAFYCQLVDPINFESVVRCLTPMETGMLQFRLGWLFIWNPLKPEGYVFLDLNRREERQMARMLILLSVIEPGENWMDKGVMPSWNSEYVPNWQLPPSWYTEQGIPDTGILKVRYYSGEGTGFGECAPDLATRVALMALVYSQPYSQDVRFTHKPTLERAEATMQGAGLKLSFIHEKQKVVRTNVVRQKNAAKTKADTQRTTR